MNHYRSAIASVAFVLCCLLSSARLVVEAPNPKHAPGNIARESDQRFSAVKAALPERGVVGYVGEPGTPALADYYLAQYALAPLVVDHSPNHLLVIGNFPTSTPTGSPSNDLQLIRDFGGGVLLYTNQTSGKDNK